MVRPVLGSAVAQSLRLAARLCWRPRCDARDLASCVLLAGELREEAVEGDVAKLVEPLLGPVAAKAERIQVTRPHHLVAIVERQGRIIALVLTPIEDRVVKDDAQLRGAGVRLRTRRLEAVPADGEGLLGRNFGG